MPSQKRNRSKRKLRKITGGASFNSLMDFSAIPKDDYYTMRNEANNPAMPPYPMDTRLLTGGNRRTKRSYKMRRTDKKKRNKSKRYTRLQKGGVNLSNYSMLGSSTNNDVIAFNSTAGTGTIANSINGNPNNGSPLPMTYPQTMSTYV